MILFLVEDNSAIALLKQSIKYRGPEVLRACDEIGNDILFFAAKAGKQTVIEFLINEYSFNLNKTNDKGETAIDIAKEYDKKELVKGLEETTTTTPKTPSNLIKKHKA